MGKWNRILAVPVILFVAVFLSTLFLAGNGHGNPVVAGTQITVSPCTVDEAVGTRRAVSPRATVEVAETQTTNTDKPSPQSLDTPLAGLQPEPLNLLNTGVCVTDTISKNINTGVQVANLNPQGADHPEIIQKMQKLQMPFIANEGQVDESVAFYAKTFGGTVFVTKNGEIVYSLPSGRDVPAGASLESERGGRQGGSGAGEQGGKGAEEQGGKVMSGWHGQAPLVRAESQFAAYGYAPLLRADNANCPPDRVLAKLLLAAYLPGLPVETTRWVVCPLSTPPHSNPTNYPQSTNSNSPNPKSAIQNLKSGIALKEQFIGAKISGIKGEGESVTKVSYFKGNDPSKWKSNISTYQLVNLGEIYEGIELKLKAHGNNVEKLLYVKPGADTEQIKIRLSGIEPRESTFVGGEVGSGKGARGLSVNEHGELEVETALGTVAFTKPIAYQEIDGKRVEVAVEYELYTTTQIIHRKGAKGAEERSEKHISHKDTKNTKEGIPGGMDCTDALAERLYVCPCNEALKYENNVTCNFDGFDGFASLNPSYPSQNSKPETQNPKLTYGFTVAAYDKTKDLIIDPLLASTYLGGSGYDYGKSLTLDTSGNVYVTGITTSTDFPTTSGAYDTSFNGGAAVDVFVSKLNSGLTSLLASTFLGGSGTNEGHSLTLDTSGNVYVTGYTSSGDFPTTSGAYDTSFNNGFVDVFVSKLNSGLTSLLASTYLGGSIDEWGYSLAIDTSGNVYVAGYTYSSDFPTTSGAYDTSFNGGGADVFVSKLNSGLTSLLASTYLGGSNSDEDYALALDTSGNVYVTGYTASEDFPTTSGAYDTSFNAGYYDVFVSKLNSGLTSLLASTYLGGSDDDRGYSLTLDTSGNVYVTGTAGSGFPTTSGAYDTSFNGSYDVFISKLNGGLTSLLASTYLGGSSSDYGLSLTLDTSGNVYVTGATDSTNFPTTSGAYDTSFNGGWSDDFVSKLNSGLTSLLASTFLGGSDLDIGQSLTLDTSGNVYVTGYTGSINFPTTSGAYDTSSNGYWDVFVSKLDGNLSAGTAQPPTVTTGDAADITVNSATLKGVVNANGLTATAWFDYGDTSGGPYSHTNTQTVTGSIDTPISAALTGLSAGTKYYYRLVAENSAGKTEGSEKTFTTSSTTFVQPSPFGLTIITHGFQLLSSSGLPPWVDEMAEAIANRFGGINTMPIYTMKIIKDTKGEIIAEKLEQVTSAPDFKSAGGAIVKVDWSELSSWSEPIPTVLVGDAVFKKLETDLSGAWLQVPIHLIGHSRGTSVNSRLAYALGAYGIWVDHFTTLDPHPLLLVDFKVKVWGNVLFADNNYRFDPPCLVLPCGIPVVGTYQRLLNGIVTGDGTPCDGLSWFDNGTAHEQVHTYYHGTILESKSLEGYDCIDHVEVQPEWYEPKYPTLPRQTGYYFSRIGKGDRYSKDSGDTDIKLDSINHPWEGLHYRLIASSKSNRANVPLSTKRRTFPNVTLIPLGQSDYKVGETVVFTYHYQDADSKLDIMFALDNDTNPFNDSDNSDYKAIGSQTGKAKRGTISAKTEFNWVPTDADIGDHYVQIKATDADGHVRYDYLLKPINVQKK